MQVRNHIACATFDESSKADTWLVASKLHICNSVSRTSPLRDKIDGSRRYLPMRMLSALPWIFLFMIDWGIRPCYDYVQKSPHRQA